MTEIDYTKWEYPETDLEIVEEFNGHIDQITDDGFWMFFQDTGGDDLQCEMKMSFIDEEYPDEKPWLKEGAYFRWRFFPPLDGEDQAQEEFVIYKQTMSKEEWERCKKEAEELWKAITWDNPEVDEE